MQNGVEVAKVIPVEERNNHDRVSEELTQKRWEVFARVEKLSERIAQHWSTEETALEAIQNDRR
jgi:phosphopantetheinyl transferase (holo-ACP synthase)